MICHRPEISVISSRLQPAGLWAVEGSGGRGSVSLKLSVRTIKLWTTWKTRTGSGECQSRTGKVREKADPALERHTHILTHTHTHTQSLVFRAAGYLSSTRHYCVFLNRSSLITHSTHTHPSESARERNLRIDGFSRSDRNVIHGDILRFRISLRRNIGNALNIV